MLLATRKTKNNLVRTVLASGVLISSVTYMNVAQAATVAVGAPTVTADSTSDYNFTADTTLEVRDGDDITNNAGKSIQTTVANRGVVTFKGVSNVNGSIGDTNRIKQLIFQNADTNDVTITGATDATTLTFQNGGAVIFNGTVGAATPSIITATGNGSALFNQNSILALSTFGAVAGDSFTTTFTLGSDFKALVTVAQNTTLNLNTGTTNANNLLVTDTATVNFLKNYTLGADLTVTGTGGGSNAVINVTAAKILGVTGETVVTDGTVTVGAGGTLNTNDLEFHGASTANLQLGTAGGAAEVDGSSVVNFNAALYTITGALTTGGTGTINVGTGNTLQVDGAITMGGSSVLNATGGVIDNDAAGVDFTLGGSAIANLGTGDVGDDMLVNNNAQVNFLGGQFNIVGDLTFANSGQASVISGSKANVGANINTVAGTQFSFNLNNTITPGVFAAGNNANIVGNEIVNVSNVNIGLIGAGATVTKTLITSAVGATIAVEPTLNAPSNLFVNYSLDIPAGNQALNLVMTRTTPTGLDDSIQGLANVFGGATAANTSGELSNLLDNLGDLNAEQQREALLQIAPLVDGGLGATMVTAQENTFDLFSQRLGELRAGLDNYNTGYSAGHMDDKGHGTWIKLFGSHADQGTRHSIPGYTAETWGLAAGIDMMITERHLIGLALSWASVDVNHDLNDADTDINSYQGSFYGSWNIQTPLFFNWMASAAHNDYDITRRTTVGAFNQTTIGDMDGWQYGARGELGYVFGERCFHITPTMSLSYSHIDFDDYREQGNSTANQFVRYKDVDTLLVGVGVSFSLDYEMERALLQPEIHTNVSYDIIGDEQEVNAQFVSFGPSYQASGASIARWDYNVGASITTWGDSGLGISISYDYDWKSSYHAHSGFVRVRYEW